MSLLDAANKHKKAKNLKWPAAKYKTLCNNFKFKVSNNGNPMVSLTLVPIEWPEEHNETCALLEEKDRKLNYPFVFSPKNSGYLDCALFLEDLGADLSQVRDRSEDPDFADFKVLFKKMLKSPPEIEIDLYWKEADDQYPKIKLLSIEKIWGKNEFAQTAPSKPAPKSKPSQDEVTLYYSDAEGNPVEATMAEMQKLVAGGYSEEVCIDGENWISLEEAGLVEKPTPKPKPKKKPAPKAKAKVEEAPVKDPEPETEVVPPESKEDDDGDFPFGDDED